MLDNWNFKDESANSSLQQVNRQKSAANLVVLQFDPSEPCATFFDPKRGERHTATLSSCDCNDFNMAGAFPRKSFKPCMHIYRLAMELGLIEAKYLDRDARFSLAGALSREETQRLQTCPADTGQWGGWAAGVHASGVQRNRQYRAYAIKFLEADSVRVVPNGWVIHGYNVSLSGCDCLDFRERNLPCKHIYVAALCSEIALSLTFDEYSSAQKAGATIIFDFLSCLPAAPQRRV